MVSSGVASRSVSSTNWGLRAPAPGCWLVDQREAPLPLAELGPPRDQPLTGVAAASEPARPGPRTRRRSAPRPSARVASAWGRPRSSRATSSSSMTSRQSPAMATSAPAHLVELGRVDVDVDDLGLGGEGVDPAGDPVVEPAAQGDQQVGPLHGGDRGVVAVHARHAQAQRVGVGEGAPGHQGGDHRDAGPLGQLAQRLGGPGLEDPAAGVDDRALGGQQQLGGLADQGRVALGHRVVAGQVEVGRLGPVPLHGGVGDVLGHVDQHRAGPAGGGHVEGLGHHPGDVGAVGDQPVVLGDAHGDAGDVALLEGVGADGRRWPPGR